LTVSNASRHQNSATSDACLVDAGLFFRHTSINQRADKAASCGANSSADKRRGESSTERAGHGHRANAGYGDCPNTD
jgi:hypothetical protein